MHVATNIFCNKMVVYKLSECVYVQHGALGLFSSAWQLCWIKALGQMYEIIVIHSYIMHAYVCLYLNV